MRAPIVILAVMLSGAVALPDTANAQLSPQGLLNGITRPFRHMFGNFGHDSRNRHNAANAERSSAEPTGSNGASAGSDLRLGRVDPPAWPSAYEDVLGYTFWPDDYAQRLRGHGFNVIADTITGRYENPRALARIATTGSAVQNDSDASNAACQDSARVQDSWPAVRVGQTIQLSNAQHDALDNIQKAVTQSAKTIKGDCADPSALPAPDGLVALVQTLWTVRDAGMAVRAPLKDFTETLTPAQKASLASKLPQDTQRPDPKNDPKIDPRNDPKNVAMNKRYQACATQNVEESERMVKQIEIQVRPNKDQAASLENLHKVSSDMAKLLMASCAQPIPNDLLARLDAADDQLTTMNYAATTVQIAFNDFYSTLDNAQKARFDAACVYRKLDSAILVVKAPENLV
jgi:hypothetical protein